MRYRNSRRFKKKNQSWYTPMLKQLPNVIKTVGLLKNVVNAEKKYSDYQFSSGTIDNNGSIWAVTPLAQGTDVNNRTGNSILASYITARFNVALDASVTSGVNFIRVMLICDRSATGTVPAVSDIIETIGSGVAPLSNNKIDTTSRYTILRNELYSLDTAKARSISKEWYVPLKFHIHYTSPVSSSYYTNNLYMLAISDQPSVPLPDIVGYVRLAFYDN